MKASHDIAIHLHRQTQNRPSSSVWSCRRGDLPHASRDLQQASRSCQSSAHAGASGVSASVCTSERARIMQKDSKGRVEAAMSRG
eukprot:scaffold180929_cov31-Tisochrysis_lutea.AAC.2